MATIKVGENETLDSALRRFKRRCSRDGIIGDLRKKEQYEKPSVRRKKKAEAARCSFRYLTQKINAQEKLLTAKMR